MKKQLDCNSRWISLTEQVFMQVSQISSVELEYVGSEYPWKIYCYVAGTLSSKLLYSFAEYEEAFEIFEGIRSEILK